MQRYITLLLYNTVQLPVECDHGAFSISMSRCSMSVDDVPYNMHIPYFHSPALQGNYCNKRVGSLLGHVLDRGLVNSGCSNITCQVKRL